MIRDKAEYALKPIEKQEAKLTVRLYNDTGSRDILPGRYKVWVKAIWAGAYVYAPDSIRVYSRELPFVTGFQGNQNTYRATQTVTMLTRSFETLAARFCQVQLTGDKASYNQNAIYSAASRQLSITLPSDIKQGHYTVKILFVSGAGSTLYDQDLDDIVTITQ